MSLSYARRILSALLEAALVAFPSSLRTAALLWQQRTDQPLTAEVLAARLADALTAEGATITNRDGAYFEFRCSALAGFTRRGIPQAIRSGAITVRSQEHSLAVDAEANVRVPTILAIVTAATIWPSILGAPPIGSIASFVVSGYFVTAIYLQGMARFRGYIDRVCQHIRYGIISAA